MSMAGGWRASLPVSALVIHIVAGVPTTAPNRPSASPALAVHVVVVVVVVVVVAIAGSVNRIVPSVC